MHSTLRNIFMLLRPYRQHLWGLIALFLISILLDLLGLGLLGQYVSVLAGAQPALELSRLPGLGPLHGNLPLLGIVLLIAFFAKTLVGISINYLNHRTASRIEAQMKAELLFGYQHLPYLRWAARNSSEYINAITVWTPQFSRVLLVPLLKLVADGLVASAILVFFALVDWRALLLFSGLLIAMGVGYDRGVRSRLHALGIRFRDLSSELVTDVRNAMDGFKEIRALNGEEFFNQRIRDHSDQIARDLSLMNTLNQTPRYLVELLMVVFAVGMTALVLTLGEDPLALLPVFGVFAAGAIRLAPTVSNVSALTTNLRFYSEVVAQLAKDRGELAQPADYKPSGAQIAKDAFSAIEVEGLAFRYSPDSEWVLRDVNLHITTGESVVLFGQSGSGKTTLMDLLLGLLSPDAGKIRVIGKNGQDLAGGLARRVAYLPQQVFLLDDSLRRNVALGVHDSEIDDNRVIAALRQAHLYELLNSLPEGLDTMLGDRGARLSGGQRQRVAVARAFYLGREILLLDEATSALDLKTELALVDELLALWTNRTLIAITHRPEVAARFQRRLLIESGRVHELSDKQLKSASEITVND